MCSFQKPSWQWHYCSTSNGPFPNNNSGNINHAGNKNEDNDEEYASYQLAKDLAARRGLDGSERQHQRRWRMGPRTVNGEASFAAGDNSGVGHQVESVGNGDNSTDGRWGGNINAPPPRLQCRVSKSKSK